MLIKNDCVGDRSSLEDWRIKGYDLLTPPDLLQHEIPITEKGRKILLNTREMVCDILNGKDDRLLVVVGPCSIHDPKAAYEYSEKLSKISDMLKKDLLIIMRAYLEKPRTTVGWKGLINDPDLDNSCQINRGLRISREMFTKLMEKVPIAGEMLDTISPQFLSDCYSLGAIGARTIESQLHRELASGLSFPIGFKNGTDGNLQSAIDAISAAKNPHYFLSVAKPGVAAIVGTEGNSDTFIILRGGKNGTNFDEENIKSAQKELVKANIVDSDSIERRIMVDCSHGNSKKDFRNQPKVIHSIYEQLKEGGNFICGVMIESNLLEGRQDLPLEGGNKTLKYGCSITDSCIGWTQTEELLKLLSEGIQKRREVLSQ